MAGKHVIVEKPLSTTAAEAGIGSISASKTGEIVGLSKSPLG